MLIDFALEADDMTLVQQINDADNAAQCGSDAAPTAYTAAAGLADELPATATSAAESARLQEADEGATGCSLQRPAMSEVIVNLCIRAVLADGTYVRGSCSTPATMCALWLA